MFQISRLAMHLRARNIRFARVFSSPLQRARLTAEGIAESKSTDSDSDSGVVVMDEALVEKHFGALEGQPWQGETARRLARLAGSEPSKLEPQESAASVAERVSMFVRQSLLPECERVEKVNAERLENSTTIVGEDAIAVVSHGITLSALWESLVDQCRPPDGVRFEREQAGRRVGWSNTGYLEVELMRDGSCREAHPSCEPESESEGAEGPAWRVTVLGTNHRGHLHGLRRTGGGIGSAAHDGRQRRLEAFVQSAERN